MSYFHTIEWGHVLTQVWFWMAFGFAIVAALLGWFKIKSLADYSVVDRETGKRVRVERWRKRYRDRFVGLCVCAMVAVVGVMSFVQSSAGWSQLGLNYVDDKTDPIYSVFGSVVFWAIFMMVLAGVYWFISAGFAEIRRQALRSELDRKVEERREQHSASRQN